ncbi:MAG: fructose bisphosphate aldolase [Anaerolineaceae bacterium]|nr:fructose bisphosphate aldolase [Anaerolineaceae bacterium]
MNKEQLERIHSGKGFIAALDQSGGSTPKALQLYGIDENQYSTNEQMFSLVHEMRTRIIKSPAFQSKYILAAILFKNTMNRTIEEKFTPDYLWEEKGVVPILKIDEGLAKIENGVQLMNPIADLNGLLKQALDKNIFGTKMRSVIKEANSDGIKAIVAQQFDYGLQICAMGLVPILEPEVDIHCSEKVEAEKLLKKEILNNLASLDQDMKLMFKITIPTMENFYADLMYDPRVVRVVALSGGYSQHEANDKLSRNHGLIASFSRALSQGLSASQTDAEFDAMLAESIQSIYESSIT